MEGYREFERRINLNKMILKEIIVFTPIYISLFWSIVFFANPYSANKPRYMLGVFMAIVVLLYASHAIFFLGYKNLYLKIDSLYLFTSLSVYPLYYIYVRLLTSDTNLKKHYFIHFVPALILGLTLLFIGILSNKTDNLVYYQSVLMNNKWPEAEASYLLNIRSALFFTSRFAFGIQAFVYLLLGYQLAKKYNHRIANFYSNLEGRELVWVKLLTMTFLITTVVSIVVNVLGRGCFIQHNWLLAIPSIIFSSILFIIGLQGSKQNFTVKKIEEEDINIEENDKEVDNGSGDNKSRTQLRNERLKVELEALLEIEKIYLNPELKITDVCCMLLTNRTYLSGFINQEFGLSFNELINRYRTLQAISLMKNDSQNLTLNDIAIASGFGSISSFTRAFKNYTGINVTQYKNDEAK